MATYDLTSSIPAASSLAAGDILNCPYSGVKKEITLPKGKYKLEVWGAQGGYRSSASYGGKGGYSYGTITLNQPTTVYLYAGGFPGNTTSSAGSSTTRAGGFNGGGSRYGYYGGGGGSDIRIGQDNLYARVIVAGGGGSDGATNKTGMYGGGASGGSASQSFGTGGGGGTQTAGGTGGSGNAGSFGQGGQGKYYSNGYAGAGGGGWYGGGGSYPDGSGDDDRGGGGGSGYILTSSSSKPSGYLLGSEYYLTDAAMVAGNASFTDYSGSTVTGHSGHGACRITAIEVIQESDGNKSFYLKTNAKSSLPSSSYVELPYIESNGTQYINTGFTPNCNTKIEIKTYFLNSSTSGFLYGARDSSSTDEFAFNTINNALRPHYNDGYYTFDTNISYKTPFIIIHDKNTFNLNNEYLYNFTYDSTFSAPVNMYLFSVNTNGSVGAKGHGRIYYCKIYDNGTLIRDYIPALRVSDSKAGLYDLVNSIFYTDATGSNFIYNRNNYLDNNTIYYIKGDSTTTNLGKSGTITNSGVTVSNNSLYFNGTDAYLKLSNNVTIGTGDFTVDWWEYETAAVDNAAVYHSETRFGLIIGYTTSGTIRAYASSNNSSWDVFSSIVMGSVKLNEWTHRALSRKGSNFYFFENGKLMATATSSASLYNAGLPVLGRYYDGTSYRWKGYLKHFRVSNCARWTSDFTPPDLEMGYGTNYAKIQESYIKTSSTTHTSQYSVYTLLPYIESNGTQYIDTGFKPNNNTRIIMDAQMMPGYTSVTYPIYFGCRDTAKTLYHELYKAGGTTSYLYFLYGPTYSAYYLKPDYTERKMIDMNKNICTMNGEVLKYSTTNTYQMNYNLFLGADNQNGSVVTNSITPLKIYSCKIYNNGTLIRDYIPAMRNSDLKIGLYDKQNRVFYPDASGGNFSCNTLDIDAATKLLLNGNITDASNNNTITNTNTTVINAKFLNDTSLFFNSSLLTTNNYNYVSGTNNFTIDWWEYPTSLVSGSAVFQAGTDYGGLLLAYLSTATDGSSLYAYGGTNTTTWDIINGVIMGTVKLNKWTHRAVSRNGNTFYFFENGKLINTATSSGSLNSTKHQIGGYTYQSGTKHFMGYINSFRISNTARWTSNFIPPTQTYGADWKKIKEIYIKRDPSTAEPKMSQYDTNIYTESDGSKWIRIFHHNNPASYLFDSTDDFTKDVYKDANRWASLYLLKDLDVKEIMVKQTAASGGTATSYRWYQPKNPIDSTYADVAKANITFHPGYTAASGSYGGVYLNKGNTYLTANNGTQSNWWGAFGSWTAHDGGTPGYSETTIKTGYMDLYIPYKEPEAWVKI